MARNRIPPHGAKRGSVGVLPKLFGRSERATTETLSGPFYKTIKADGGDFNLPGVVFEVGPS